MTAMNILIVDDDISMSRTMALVLKKKGYSVTVVDSGQEAVSKVCDTTFDIIFMDIRMPEMDGVQALLEIRRIRPDAVVMMMTAFAVEELVKKALDEGAYGIIYKPLDIEKVIVGIEDVEKSKGGMLILVVDEDPITAKTLKDTLMEKGHQVGIAPSGEDAISMAEKKAYDIIFIDMKLPTISGLQTYLELKKVHPDVIAVFMTAEAEQTAPLIDKGLFGSVHSVLYKPFDMAALLHIVDEISKEKNKKRL